MKFNKILIVRLSAIGDVINTLPALQVLRTNFPKSFIAWVVEDRSRDLLIDHPQLDKVFVFERKKWRPGIRSLKSWRRFSRTLKEVRSFVRQIKNEKFDLALDFQGNFKSGLTTYLSGARERVGFDKQTSKEANHLFLTQKIKLPTEPLNRVARNLHLLKSLGLNTREYTPVVSLPTTGQTAINDFLKNQNLTRKELIVLHPGTSRFGLYKRWPAASYSKLADKLSRLNKKYAIIIACGPGERALADEISAQATQPGIVSCSLDSLSKLGTLLKKARLFIGSDSAPLHLASALKTPLIGLYGPKDPKIYGPYRHPRSLVLTKDLPCQPCRKRTCRQPDCMTLITADDVFHAARKLLKTT